MIRKWSGFVCGCVGGFPRLYRLQEASQQLCGNEAVESAESEVLHGDVENGVGFRAEKRRGEAGPLQRGAEESEGLCEPSLVRAPGEEEPMEPLTLLVAGKGGEGGAEEIGDGDNGEERSVGCELHGEEKHGVVDEEGDEGVGRRGSGGVEEEEGDGLVGEKGRVDCVVDGLIIDVTIVVLHIDGIIHVLFIQ